MKYTVMGAYYKLKGGCWNEGMSEPLPSLLPPLEPDCTVLLELHNEYRQ